MRARARIDAGAIERNCRRLGDVAGTRLCVVVKADGYGHGAVTASRAAQAAGAEHLAVATALEAQALRAAGVEGPLLVLGALDEGELRIALEARAEIAVWREAVVAALPAGTAVHVKLDSGMGRLGTRDAAEATRVARAVADRGDLTLRGAWTHFATADDDEAFAREQLAAFLPWAQETRALGDDVLVHAANSAATFGIPESRLDMVRCGVAAYGLDPYQRDPAEHGLAPALALESHVAAVKPIRAGQSAGYGRRFVADRDGWLATVPVGYADGVRRALSGNADVLIGGRRHALVGTVSMDNVTVDLGTGAAPDVEGAPVVLLGRQGDARILAEEWAQRIGTINYEVTCGISARVPREAGCSASA